jgi:hypothetical protein
MLPRLFILLHLVLLNSIASFAADASAVAVEPVAEDPIVVPDFSTLAGYPASETAVGAEILRRLYMALIDYKLETDILSPRRKARLALAKDALQEEYKAHAAATSIDLEVDDTFQEPVIFDSITELANAAGTVSENDGISQHQFGMMQEIICCWGLLKLTTKV